MAAQKTTARRSTARKSTAKSTAKKSTAKKTTARRAPTKKSVARKSTTRRTTARRPATKKRTAPKTTARKSAAKKSTSKKSTSRKSTARKSAAKSIPRKSMAKRATSIRRTTAPAAANKRVVSAIEGAWNTGDLTALDKHFARGYRNHAAMPGMETDLRGAKNTHAMVIQAFPDRNVELLDIVAEGDRVAIRTRVTGTNNGGAFWFGAPANDRAIDFESWALYRLEGAKVVESWGLNDGLTALVQLGTWEPPQPPETAPDREEERTLSLVGAE
jgi:predicted ester cyclase